MHPSRIAGSAANAYSEPPGGLAVTERWWRDRYNEIAEQGYQLRPRYRPNWQPSWLKSGKQFYKVEDGQASIVRVAAIILISQLIYFSTDFGDS